MSLRLKLTVTSNPRMYPLLEGEVKAEGIDFDLNVVPGRAAELFGVNLEKDDFEVSEMSFAESLLTRERREEFGNGRWDWAYIPVFFGRGLNWDRIVVRDDGSVNSAADLNGKRVAVRDYTMTALLTFRALLKDLYGIETSDITWLNLGNRGKTTGLDRKPPHGVDLIQLPGDADALGMLVRGEVDAVHGAQDTPAGTKQLFPDGPRELADRHFREHGVQHINHHFVVQRRILEAEPWIARSLYDAFAESGRIAIERARKYAPAYLYFENSVALSQDKVYGTPPYESGIAANRKTLERLSLAGYEQGLTLAPVPLEELYIPSLLDT